MSRYALSDINRLYERVSTVQLIHILSFADNPAPAVLDPAERALFEELTPELVYVLTVGGDIPSVVWAAEPAELREWLEHTVGPAKIMAVSRAEPADSKDITDDFARTWINDRGNFDEEFFDDFLRKLGNWLENNYEDLAREIFGADRG